MPKLPEPIDFSYRRPRTLDPATNDPSARQLPDDKDRSRLQTVNKIYGSYKRASDKANVIMKAAEDVAKKYTIPVPEEAVEVRQAVLRQDPDSGGEHITFELFSKMIDIVESQATKVDYNVIDTRVLADPAANERVIQRQLDSRIGDDDDIQSLLLVGGHIMTLYVMHLIQGIWRGPEKAAAAPRVAGAAPVEQATPIAEAILEGAIGVATAQTILGINQLLAYMFANDGNERHTDKTTIEGGISEAKQIDLPPLVGKIQKAMGLNDHKVIMRYCTKYISETTERGYEFWWAYLIARRTRYFSARSISSSSMFSQTDYAEKNFGYKTDGSVLPDEINLDVPYYGTVGPSITEGLAAELVDGLNRSVVSPTDDFMLLKGYEASSFEQGLNFVAQVLDTRVSRDVMCCFAHFLGNVDLDTLRKIRAVLGIAINAHTVDLDATIENFSPFLMNWVKDTALSIMFELVQAILDKIVRLVSEFILDLEPDIQYLESCPMIMSMIQEITSALEAIIHDINELVHNYSVAIELNLMVSFGLQEYERDYVGARPGLLLVHKKRSLRRMLIIIDGIINVIENSFEICDEDEVLQHTKDGNKFLTYDQVIDSPAFSDIEDHLGIPDDVKGKYFSDAAEVILADGTQLPAYDVGELLIWSSDRKGPTSCLPYFGDPIMDRVLSNYKRNK